MSARSSSGSWPGAGRAPDIIDLDRYMRGSARPQPPARRDDCDRLVVDMGGAGVGVGKLVSSSSDSAPRGKRYSHDSGLSDGSYVRRRHRSHRRIGGPTGGARATGGATRALTTAASANSMRTFRAACERALRDQQEQIARVAQICERLAVAGGGRAAGAGAAGGCGPGGRPEGSCSPSADSSELSSSSRSRSTRDSRRKDKHRTDECKTYKIIMTKLDELNRLFAVRAAGAPGPGAPGGGPPHASVARKPPVPHASRSSVTVCDKLVATEPQLRAAATLTRTPDPPPTPRLVERAVGSQVARPSPSPSAGGRAPRHSARRTHEPDAAPRRSGRLNVATDSLLGESTDSTRSSRYRFDLEDPVHLYAQAKRLQALHASTGRARSVDARGGDGTRVGRQEEVAQSCRGAKASGGEEGAGGRYVSLCGVCRGYWRALRHCLAQQFYSPDSA